ncbi:MAG: biotin/lipoyl-binding protein [Balneolia bacterium]|nr:biotin/lipoyl-binding protein [Balneolia bacterium]
MNFETTIKETRKMVTLSEEGNEATIGESKIAYSFERLDHSRYVLRVGTESHILSNVTINETQMEFTLDGEWYQADVKDDQMLLLDRLGFKVGSKSGEGVLKAPMPGKIVSVLADEGSEVQQGDPIIILEAMKMENELKAPSSGIIKKISVSAGESVEKNVTLLEIEAIG